MGVAERAVTNWGHFEARAVNKHFGGVHALRDVSLTIERGTIHALIGENGAGKSTFGKIVAGFYSPDAGQLFLNGQPVKFRSPRDALRAGITIVGQERSIVPQRTVLDNVFLGRESRRGGFINKRAMRSRYEALSQSVGFDLPPDARVGRLRVSEQLQVEILRALVRDARLLVMDETGQADSGSNIMLTVIAAIVIGGTSIFGGEGAIWRAVLGILLLTLIGNGFDLLNINPLYQQVLQGLIILFAVGLDAWTRRTA
ncbi:MAG TPA: ATP-binding cassette domain-containing protein [Chloroflexota bacterium]|nr:ATP-binding cassette domain-containing protein [Chloroflexota bacterium]